MKKAAAIFLFGVLFFAHTARVHSFEFSNFWQYPEMADKHALFAGVFAASFSMLYENYFQFIPEVHLDYVLPFGFPLSLGASARAFDGSLFACGLRPGYHVNLGDENTDLYALFTVDLVFQGEFIFLDYGGRIGLRRRFGRFLCAHVESGHKFQSLNMGISIKIN